jgi:hypothetical protein
MSSVTPRIAIIGGGLSGIMAGRELTKMGLRPRIFEASKGIGGLWSKEFNRMWNSLKTNLSKHTCVVSSLDWPLETATFPSKTDVDHYINKLAENLEVSIDTKVSKIEFLNSNQYKVCWKNPTSNSEEMDIFDHVIVASGFFSKSILPSNLDCSKFSGQIITSHEYQEPSSFSGKKVLIVGGSFSGCEIAAEIASVAEKVYHVVPHHAYILPTFIPEDLSNPATSYLPLDLAFYKLSDTRLEELESILENEENRLFCEKLTKTNEEIQNTHAYFQQMLGTSNDVLRPLFATEDLTIRVVISDHYRKMMKMQKIELLCGKLLSLEDEEITIISPPSVSSSTQHEPSIIKLPIHVDACIIATGFQPDSSIFCEHILSTLQYNGSNDHSSTAEDTSFLPYLLHREILHPQLPGLYFVGMYKGPYFGIIELQAVSHLLISYS